MKATFKFALLAVFCLFITSSCKKEIDYHPEWSLSTMSGKIDGNLLECTLASTQFYTLDNKTTVQIIGNKGVKGFGLTIDNFKGVGTYKVADHNIATYMEGAASLQDAYYGTSAGTIKVTSYLADKYIKGTFEFKGENIAALASKTITEGQFSVSLVPVKLPETNNSTNNLSAKIDGTKIGFTGEASSINSPLGKLLTITTINGDKRLILSVIGYKGVGTYDLANDGTGVYMKDQSPTGSFSAASGTLVVTSEAGNKLKGTFAFKAPNENGTINTSVDVTEGTFDLPFSKL
ncbi:hypothetical protein OC25_12745 [Pedobacter kyungheensis]|uniref:DUF5689 domain-containing protein n=1 Tax=Pedobacter kyungheensis TaxID=1069985 RepID=A0A0C1DHA6_9SPHI|nr:DUF6252 family protein [Pedobacter kyungheensis]KIA93305.1 hypothetical protein OC25_12745 [Pedobacter kyungheensis]